MSEFWNRFWYSMVKMSQKEMSNINFSDLFLACIMAVIIVQLVGLIYSRLARIERNKHREHQIMFLLMIMLLMWEIAVTGREVMSERIIRTNIWWFGTNMDDNTANLLNIIFFVPFGVIVTCIQGVEKGWRRLLMTGCYSFLMSLSIELLQYITIRGYSEFVDLETNVVGGLLGAAFIMIVDQCKESRKETIGEE